MECNKEEAIRAKIIAETKMENKDFAGARRMAIKAQKLYPDLQHINQIICLCDVHCPTENRNLGNEKDWYGILKVEQSADEVSIKKQYYKLALLLHPDKNKFAGAEAAFLLIGEAQKVLLDKEKRSFFDARYKMFSQNTAPNPPPPKNKNSDNVKPSSGKTNATKKASSSMKKEPQKQAANVKPPSGHTSTTPIACPHVEKQPEEHNMKPPSGQANATQNSSAEVKRQSPRQANNVKPPSGQTNATKNTCAHVKKQPQQQANVAKPPPGQTNATQYACAHVKKQPQQHAIAKPPSGQANATQNACAHVKMQQTNVAKPPSGQTNTTQTGNSNVKKQPQQQASNVKPRLSQTNTTHNPCSPVKNQTRQQAKSGDDTKLPTFQTRCPYCREICRYFRYALKKSIPCMSCKMEFTAYENKEACAESAAPQSNANKTATRARIVSTQGMKCSSSNSRSPQGNSGHQKRGLDLFSRSGKTTKIYRSNKPTEETMGGAKISRTTSGGCSHLRANTVKVLKKSVESGGGFKSKGAINSKDTVSGSGCGGVSSNQQCSQRLKRHGSDDGTLNTSKRAKTKCTISPSSPTR